MIRKIIIVLALMTLVLTPTLSVKAWYNCGGYVTVQWGDTLSGLAAMCGTTVEAVRSANPGLGWWLYAGQVIYLPSGYASQPVYNPYPTGNTYIVQPGDTLAIIAVRYGMTVYDLWAANPQIWNPSLIYVGQAINIPVSYAPPPPPVVYPAPYPIPSYPTSIPPGSNTLKITYKKGLIVRDSPGGDIIGWATYDEYKEWCYYPGSITKDSVGKVWVQVDLNPPQHGYTTGWILVKDQYGGYFTSLTLDW